MRPIKIGRSIVEPRRAAKSTSIILVLNQYKCIGCSPGKHPDNRTMATGSDDDSRDEAKQKIDRILARLNYPYAK
jgi:hypothetical protein